MSIFRSGLGRISSLPTQCVIRCIASSTVAIACLACCATQAQALEESSWRIGFAKQDITPMHPVRLSGYGVRTDSHVAVADPLHVRVMVLAPIGDDARDANSVVLVSMDSIAATGSLTKEIADWLSTEYSIPRSQLAVSSTHSHTAPHLAGGLNNLFTQALSDEQVTATEAYTRRVTSTVQATITAAMQARQPGWIEIGDGQAGFAVNRRVLTDGKWTGFGEQADGLVDHRVRVMLAYGGEGGDGDLLGGAYLYANHCTTLGSDFNRVSGDWAGLSASRLEAVYNQTVFLPIIGCGADANPNPRNSYEFAQQHAAELVDSVRSVVESPERVKITDFPETKFGYAGLVPEQPTSESIAALANDPLANNRRWAEHMRTVKQEMGRLPETVPMPIHTWSFGDALAWVFLGGEVVVEYQFSIEKELSAKQTWVAAYTDDVFAYVASEAMRPQGGYEVDFSMIYYLQPGRWESGTQSLIVRRVKEILNNTGTESEPLSANEALRAIRVPDDFQIELVAAEPLVQDPINVAFGADGSVWVVEMSDYPEGTTGGRVKRLRDTDADGQLDHADEFLVGLPFPTSVAPWLDGVLVISAPDVLFAADRDGDGKAEVIEKWLSGLSEANPQHRASGFELGLDGWLYFGAGDDTHAIYSPKASKTFSVRGQDLAWNPETGEVRAVAGATQFVRARDAYGNWFGNSNSQPIYQYVIEDRYLANQDSHVGQTHGLLSPAIAPPVYPRSAVAGRFNDLFAQNRFTSACSSIVGRVPGLGPDFDSVGLTCEPVHNLVARFSIEQRSAVFGAQRHPGDTEFDFFTSTDSFTRPVRVVNAPDGTVWVVDMVRKVIEHPEWIPRAWQERVDVRAGSQLGRIYRVFHRDFKPTSLPVLSDEASRLDALASDNGALRDLAMLSLLQSSTPPSASRIRTLATNSVNSAVRASALGCLSGLGELSAEDVTQALRDKDARVVRYALVLSEDFGTSDLTLQELALVPSRELGPAVDLQWILTAMQLENFKSASGMATIAKRASQDRWLQGALSLVREPDAAYAACQGLLESFDEPVDFTPQAFADKVDCVKRLWNRADKPSRDRLAKERLASVSQRAGGAFSNAELALLSLVAETPPPDVNEKQIEQLAKQARARLLAADVSDDERLTLMGLIGSGLSSEQDDLSTIRKLLVAEVSEQVQLAAIESLRRIKSDGIPATLISAWPSLNQRQRTSACSTLLTSKPGAVALVASLESGQVSPSELAPAIVQQLRSHPDRDLRSRCIAVFGQPSPRAEIVKRYLAVMPAPRADTQGEKLFRENCAVCHQANPSRGLVGPPLENLKHWTIDQWVTAVFDPNQSLEPKYRQTSVLTEDGQIVSGVIQSQSQQVWTIALADGTLRTVPRDDIIETRETMASLMPEGFEDKLTPEQLASLLGYLRTQL